MTKRRKETKRERELLTMVRRLFAKNLELMRELYPQRELVERITEKVAKKLAERKS